MDAAYWYFNRSSPELCWEQKSRLQLIIHLQTKALIIMTQERTHLDFTPFFTHPFKPYPSHPSVLSQTYLSSKHLSRAHKLPATETNTAGVLSFLPLPLFMGQSLLVIAKLYSMGDVWSKSYMGEVFQILDKQWDSFPSGPPLFNEICVVSGVYTNNG